MANPKIEFYKFKLKPKKASFKTFKDFVIDEFNVDTTITNKEAFQHCFDHFIEGIDLKHAKDEKVKKTLTVITDPKLNPYLPFQPSPLLDKNVIVGVINGGPYDKDAIVSDIAGKKQNSQLGRNNSVLLPYFMLLYIPADHDEGCFIIHSNSSEESITNIYRNYISNLFKGNNYYRPTVEAYCPKSFQDEFKNGAVIKSLVFNTSIVESTPSTNAIGNLLNEYNIKIEAIPKKKNISITDGQGVIDFFSKKIFNTGKKAIDLNDFGNKKLNTENEITKAPKVFEWNTRDNDFIPVVYLNNRVKFINETPDFSELKDYCLKLLNDDILKELRPDLYVTKT